MRLTGPWSIHAKVKGMVLKAAWHCGSNGNVVNGPLVGQCRTPLYVGLLSAWGSVDGDRMFSPFWWEGFLTGNSDGYKWMNIPLALEMKHLSIGTLLGEHGGGAHLPRTSREMWIIRGRVEESSGNACLRTGPFGEPEGGCPFTGNFGRLWKRAPETGHLSIWAHCEGNLEGALYLGPWKLCRGRLWWRASLSLGAPLGNLEEGLL